MSLDRREQLRDHHLEELLAVCTVPPCVNQVRGISVWCLHAIDASNFHR